MTDRLNPEFNNAVHIVMEFSPTGDLIEGVENMESLIEDFNDGLIDSDPLTAEERKAFSLIYFWLREIMD